MVARYKKAKGFNVLHPMGYDAFGLPAEQYAIQTGIHPSLRTKEAIEEFRRQLKSVGYSFNWDREVSTCEPTYYKWTQFIFKRLFKKGLAYKKGADVNWCPALKTVLANEEVVDGKSERGGHEVFRQKKDQWMLKITSYSDKLLKGLKKINWPESTKLAQKNWIGESMGASLIFEGKDQDFKIEVFTTRADTLFGATYMVLAPEHPLVDKITLKEKKKEVEDYKNLCLKKSERDRKSDKDKTGVFIGAYVLHPLTEDLLPVWISDYVLMDYGTGAIMSVPAHDERDFEFAKKFDLKIKPVIEAKELPFDGRWSSYQLRS